jgi:inosine/xanthosine triphosphate pyrophosphatase family protein
MSTGFNILEHAQDIVYRRGEETSRKYGPMKESMEKAAALAAVMTGKPITAKDMYLCMVALKLSRESYSKKYDNVLDSIAYLTAMVEHYKEDYDKTK